MDAPQELIVRRRQDGSIDIDFYAHRATLLHRAAVDDARGRCIGLVGRTFLTLARTMKMMSFAAPRRSAL